MEAIDTARCVDPNVSLHAIMMQSTRYRFTYSIVSIKGTSIHSYALCTGLPSAVQFTHAAHRWTVVRCKAPPIGSSLETPGRLQAVPVPPSGEGATEKWTSPWCKITRSSAESGMHDKLRNKPFKSETAGATAGHHVRLAPTHPVRISMVTHLH